MVWLLEPNTKGVPVLRWNDHSGDEREWARTELLLTRLARITEEAMENVRAVAEDRAPKREDPRQMMVVPAEVLKQLSKGRR